MFLLRRNQAQRITFVMIDVSGIEVTGIATLTVQISKNGAAFAAGAGAVAEIGGGWYSYDLTASETDTVGPLALAINGGSAMQQNLLFSVETLTVGAVEFTYTLLDDSTLLPIEGAAVWFSTDAGGVNTVWSGETDSFGVVRDGLGRKPWLQPGQYFVWRSKPGYAFDDPDTEDVG